MSDNNRNPQTILATLLRLDLVCDQIGNFEKDLAFELRRHRNDAQADVMQELGATGFTFQRPVGTNVHGGLNTQPPQFGYGAGGSFGGYGNQFQQSYVHHHAPQLPPGAGKTQGGFGYGRRPADEDQLSYGQVLGDRTTEQLQATHMQYYPNDRYFGTFGGQQATTPPPPRPSINEMLAKQRGLATEFIELIDRLSALDLPSYENPEQPRPAPFDREAWIEGVTERVTQLGNELVDLAADVGLDMDVVNERIRAAGVGAKAKKEASASDQPSA